MEKEKRYKRLQINEEEQKVNFLVTETVAKIAN